FIKPEAEGLRITMPKDRGNTDPIGLSMPVTVAGDFEIIAALEILQAEEPPAGNTSYGVGVLMSVNEKLARVGRLARYKHQAATWDRWATVKGKDQWLNGGKQIKGNAGRLRIKRTQAMMHLQWAPELEGDNFEEVYQFESGPEE